MLNMAAAVLIDARGRVELQWPGEGWMYRPSHYDSVAAMSGLRPWPIVLSDPIQPTQLAVWPGCGGPLSIFWSALILSVPPISANQVYSDRCPFGVCLIKVGAMSA